MSEDIKKQNNNVVDENINKATLKQLGRTSRLVNRLFKTSYWVIDICGIAICCYWLTASDRYVSDAVVLVQNTESGGTTDSSDLLNMFNVGTGNQSDQLLLSEYLVSLDMLKKLDKKFDLRSHYSDKKYDFLSRLWYRNIPIEWFYKYFLQRVSARYDDYNGVVRIDVQAFDPEMAQKISDFMVNEGEHFMNQMSHNIADEQVIFLERQVEIAKNDLLNANQKLLQFQNKKNISSPTVEVENNQKLIADLEKQKTDLMIKLSSLPKSVSGNNQITQTLNKNLTAVEAQLKKVRGMLTSENRTSLNELVEQEQLLKMDVDFKKEIYSSALTGLVKGRMNAARLIKHVSILQSPSLPEYALKPDRIYCLIATILTMILILGMFKLLRAVVLDHVD